MRCRSELGVGRHNEFGHQRYELGIDPSLQLRRF
jgi:hypothetical protein